MKNLFLITSAVIAFGACSAASEPSHSSQAVAPVVNGAAALKASASSDVIGTPVKAVRIYADWCSKCKVLDAQLKELKAAQTYSNVEFIYLDYTEKNPDIFYAQAKELGVEDQVKAAFNGGRIATGQMFIFDASTDALLKTIKHTGSNEELSAALTEIY